MRSFKRWMFGAIVLGSLVLVACPGMVPTITKEIPNMQFAAGATEAKTVRLDSYFQVDRDAGYKATSDDTSVAAVDVSGSVLTVTPKGPGTANVEVTASKGGTDPVSQSFTVTVEKKSEPVVTENRPPTLTDNIASQTLNRGTAKEFDLSTNFTDPDDDALTYSADSDDMDVATAEVAEDTLTISAKAVGNAEISVTATDGDGATAQLRFHVTVEVGGNTAPNVKAEIPNQYVRVGEEDAMLTLSDHFADGDGDTLMYTPEASEDIVNLTVDNAAGTLTITGVATGSTTVTVSADDRNSLELARQSFMVTVKRKVNHPPTMNSVSTDVSLRDGQKENYDLGSYFTDPEGDPLTFTDGESDNPAVATVERSGMTLTITATGVGEATVTVSASDEMTNDDLMTDKTTENPATQLEFNVVVVAKDNAAPTAEGTIPDVTVDKAAATPMTTVPLADYFMDADGDTLTYAVVADADDYDPMIAMGEIEGTSLKITAIAFGETMITVTASDNVNDHASQTVNVTVVYTGPNDPPHQHPDHTRVPDQTAYVGADPLLMVDLADHWRDPNRDPIYFTAVSANLEFATLEQSGSTITITGVAPGRARIDITATDKKSESVRDYFYVDVKPVRNGAPTAIPGVSMDVSVQMGAYETLNLMNYFKDPEGDMLTYTLTPDDAMIAKGMVDEGTDMLKIMGVGVGETTIKVTASDEMSNDGTANEAASVTFNVTVTPAAVGLKPDAPDPPRVELMTDGSPKTLDLSTYFMDPPSGYMNEYDVDIDTSGRRVARATVSGSTLTITALGAGSATITVTATAEAARMASVVGQMAADMVKTRLEIMVRVTEPSNLKPRLKTDMQIGPFMRTVDDNAVVHELDLDKYFTDPDGSDALLTYRVKQTKETPDVAEMQVISVGGGDAPATAGCTAKATDDSQAADLESLPDGTDLGDDMIWICYHEAGTAELEITAVDVGGKDSDPVTVMIEVAANTNPERNTDNTIDNYVGAADTTTAGEKPKLKIDDPTTVVDGPFSDYFVDDDHATRVGDMLTFEVVFLSGALLDGADHSVIMAALTGTTATVIEKDDDGYGAVVANMSPMEWNGATTAKFTLTLTGRKGTAMGADANDQTVAIVATDRYGRKTVRTFSVGVNHDPVAMGAQEKGKEKTLSGLTDHQKITATTDEAAPAAAGTGNDFIDVVLVEAEMGYFSDGDGPADLANGNAATGAGCAIKGTGGNDKVAKFMLAETANTVTLHINPETVGTRTVTISCKDTFGQESRRDTLTVTVTGTTGASRQ